MTLIAALAICGFGFAQETHWPEFNLSDFPNNLPVVGFVQIDGEYVTTDNYADMEVAAFVNGECRGHMFMNDYTEDGDPYPIFEMSVYYDNSNEPLTFQLYNHATGVLYEDCVANMDIVTGEEHVELYFDYDEAVVLSFTGSTTGFEKRIVGYGDGNANWYLISSPVGQVNPSNVENMLTKGGVDKTYDLYYFNPAATPGEEWVNRKGENNEIVDFDLMPGQGYLYANLNTDTLRFTGAYEGDGTVTLTKAGEEYFQAWNLVGNPFGVPAYIDRSFYRMNEEGSAILPDTYSDAIGLMEGVFVIASEDGEQMTFSTEAPGEKANLAINVSQGRSVADRAIITFGESSALPKFQLNQNSTKVYIPQEGKDYAVVSAGEIGEMPVNFKAESNGTYNMNFTSEAVNFSYLHLIDNMTGNDVDLLATPSYSFDALTTDYASRFRLVFATSNGNEDNFAFFNNGNLVINNDGKATLQVVDVAGRILNSESINGSATIKLNVAAGVYMIRLINGDNVKVQKVVVR